MKSLDKFSQSSSIVATYKDDIKVSNGLSHSGGFSTSCVSNLSGTTHDLLLLEYRFKSLRNHFLYYIQAKEDHG
jgi:hypothetical protein